MAKLYPSHDIINLLHGTIPSHEQKLLDFLKHSLNDEFEIYYRPTLNGDKPPVVILRKDFGALLINIFDYPLNDFYIKDKYWYYKNNPYISPFNQVASYKNNLYNLHVEELMELTIKNTYHFTIVKTVVYFPEEATSSVKNFINEYTESYDKKDIDFKYSFFFGNDVIKRNDIEYLTKKGNLNTKSNLFTNELYESFKRYLIPSFHAKDQGSHLNYSKKQKELIISKPREIKIKGVVGSGKTYLVAKRAVNAHLRTDSDVLILTYNISLKNYIKEIINKVQEDFYWDYFYINHYHQFFNQQANNVFLKVKSLSAYDNINYFESSLKFLPKFDTVIIDEIQDYWPKWVKIIKKYFLKENGEFVVFGDEKQNIYKRKLEEDKKPYTGIPGQWNLLNESFRSKNKILRLAEYFQIEFLSDIYDFDEIKAGQQTEIFEEKEHLDYMNFSNYNRHDQYLNIFQYINNTVKKHNISPEDITILSLTTNILRPIDYLWRIKKNEKTATTYETYEIYIKTVIDNIDKNDIMINDGFNLFYNNKTNMIRSICLYDFSKTFNNKALNDYLAAKKLNIKECNVWIENFHNHLDFLRTYKGNDTVLINKTRSIRIKLHNKIETIRRNKKIHFRHSGFTKLSTIHSYKGWESHTVFLLIEDEESASKDFSSNELIYTGLTRAMVNLFVINLSKTKYPNFFEKNM
jgi:hypothetical protein